ncbi:hypothetical protein D3C87_1377590 [compost metagenome]
MRLPFRAAQQLRLQLHAAKIARRHMQAGFIQADFDMAAFACRLRLQHCRQHADDGIGARELVVVRRAQAAGAAVDAVGFHDAG